MAEAETGLHARMIGAATGFISSIEHGEEVRT
jgi:hypothetical protein